MIEQLQIEFPVGELALFLDAQGHTVATFRFANDTARYMHSLQISDVGAIGYVADTKRLWIVVEDCMYLPRCRWRAVEVSKK